MALLVDSAYLALQTSLFLQLYVVAQGSFIKERQDLNDNYCHMCSAGVRAVIVVTTLNYCIVHLIASF